MNDDAPASKADLKLVQEDLKRYFDVAVETIRHDLPPSPRLRWAGLALG